MENAGARARERNYGPVNKNSLMAEISINTLELLPLLRRCRDFSCSAILPRPCIVMLSGMRCRAARKSEREMMVVGKVRWVEVHEDEREDGWDYGFCYVGWFCGVWNDVRAWWFGF